MGNIYSGNDLLRARGHCGEPLEECVVDDSGGLVIRQEFLTLVFLNTARRNRISFPILEQHAATFQIKTGHFKSGQK